MPSDPGLDALRHKLRDRDIEVASLNEVIMRQGRSLQQHSQASIDVALKRKEGILRTHMAKVEKLEAENEALKENLHREELARRDAETSRDAQQHELKAAAEMREVLKTAMGGGWKSVQSVMAGAKA